jgi:hypothetical protein
MKLKNKQETYHKTLEIAENIFKQLPQQFFICYAYSDR